MYEYSVEEIKTSLSRYIERHSNTMKISRGNRCRCVYTYGHTYVFKLGEPRIVTKILEYNHQMASSNHETLK